jgi:hypothetical protein
MEQVECRVSGWTVCEGKDMEKRGSGSVPMIHTSFHPPGCYLACASPSACTPTPFNCCLGSPRLKPYPRSGPQ